jgi:hypothetical protein
LENAVAVAVRTAVPGTLVGTGVLAVVSFPGQQTNVVDALIATIVGTFVFVVGGGPVMVDALPATLL